MDRTAEEATRQQRDDDGQDSFEKKTRAGHRTKSRTKAGTEPEKKAEIVTCRVRKNSASGGKKDAAALDADFGASEAQGQAPGGTSRGLTAPLPQYTCACLRLRVF